MPRIPQYGDTVDLAPIPGVRQSGGATGDMFFNDGGAGAIGKALTGAAAVFDKMQEREDADMLFRAETALKDDYLKYERTVRDRKGQNAWGVTTETEQWFAEQDKKHSENLTNDRQRKLFGQSIAKLRLQSLSSIGTYEGDQRRASLEASAQSSIVGSINQAAALASSGYQPAQAGEQTGAVARSVDENGNPVASVPGVAVGGGDQLLGIKRDIIKRVQFLSQVNGWDEEQRKVEEEKHLTNFHTQVIKALVNKYPDRAAKYYEDNIEEIKGVSRDGVEDMIRIGETKQAGFQFVRREDIQKLSEQHQLDAARDHFKNEPEKRDAAIREIKMLHAERRQIRENGQADAYDEAWQIYSQTKNFNAIPADVLSRMDGRARGDLEKQAEHAATGAAVKTDMNTYIKLRQMPDSDFVKVDLRTYAGSIGKTEMEQLLDRQDRMKKPDKAHELASDEKQISIASGKLGLKKEDKAEFEGIAYQALRDESKRLGKALSEEERQKVIDRLLMQGEVVRGKWYMTDPDRRYYQVYGKPESEQFAPEISAADKKTITDRFQKNKGRAPTEQELLQTYKKWKGL